MAVINYPATGVRNYIINSNFDFWQRATSQSTILSGGYVADRFNVEYDGTLGTHTLSRQAFTLGQTDVPNNPTYFMRWNHTTAGSGSTYRRIGQRIESARTLAGKTTTLTFWAKCASTATVNVGYRQFFGTSGSPSAAVENTSVTSINLTTTWQRFTVQMTIPSIAGKTLGTDNNDYLAVLLSLPINAVMTIDLAQVMYNEGAYAAPYARIGDSIAQELIACQRFYHFRNTVSRIGFTDSFNFFCGSQVDFPVEMRAVPGIVQSYNGVVGRFARMSSGATVDGTTTSSATTHGIQYMYSSSALPTNNVAYWFDYTANAEL